MAFGQFFMFHNFSIAIFIFQVYQSVWEPCLYLVTHRKDGGKLT